MQSERWPVRGEFRISRSTITENQTMTVEINEGEFCGRGECEPHESDSSVVAHAMHTVQALQSEIAAGMGTQELQRRLPSCPARNAIDCALWDLEAKLRGNRVWELLRQPMQDSFETAYTLSIDSPERLAARAKQFAAHHLLKIKLGGSDIDDLACVRAVREARPDARLIVDANGAWTLERLRELAPMMSALGVELIEQPLDPAADDDLRGYSGPVALCADESCIDRASLPQVVGKYQFVNIKLDKTGGLTEALALASAARAADLRIMVGCMVGTSLAMAPATLIAQFAEFVDLDGPILLERDRSPSITYREGRIFLPPRDLWG